MRTLVWSPAPDVATLNNLPVDAQERIAADLLNKFKNWQAMRQGYESVWRAIDRHVSQYDPVATPMQKAEYGNTIDGMGILGSKLKMSNAYSHREGIVAAVIKFLMANDYDFFDVVPLDPMDQEITEAVKQYIIYLFEEMDFENDFTPFLRDLVTYGTAVASYEWIYEQAVRWKTETVAYGENRMSMKYKASEVIYNAPKFTPLSLYNTMIDPTAKDLRTATLIFKKRMTIHEIMADTAYKDLSPEYLMGVPDAVSDLAMAREMERETARGNTAFSPSTAYQGKKDVYEAWGDFTDGVKLYQNYVAEILDGKLIRFEPNPYDLPHKPFVIARYCSETERVYGQSPMAPIVGIQSGYDTLVNQVIDANAMYIERPILVQEMTLVQDKNDRKSAPPMGKNVMWRVRSTDGVARLKDDSNNAVASSIPILNLLDTQMKQATGNTELISGGEPDRYVNTGVAVAAADAGNAKFNMYAKTIEREAIIPVLEMTIDLLRQAIVEPKTFKSNEVSGNVIKFDPSMLLYDMKFTMRGASHNATRQLQINAAQQFYQTIGSNPLTAQLMNWIRVIIDMGDLLGIRNIRSQILPEAAAALQQMPPTQAPWYENVLGLFQKQQQSKQLGDQSLGTQLSTSMAPISGAGAPGSGQPSPFDATSPRGAAV